jgi:hypothetical protein
MAKKKNSYKAKLEQAEAAAQAMSDCLDIGDLVDFFVQKQTQFYLDNPEVLKRDAKVLGVACR